VAVAFGLLNSISARPFVHRCIPSAGLQFDYLHQAGDLFETSAGLRSIRVDGPRVVNARAVAHVGNYRRDCACRGFGFYCSADHNTPV
jgi:hypothetical protein